MAAKFIVAVALFALCRANPVLINGEVYRDGRAYSRGEASSNGGTSQAQATANGDAAQAFGSSTANGAQLARDGLYYPGNAIAQAQAYEAPESLGYGTAKAVAEAHNNNAAYYRVPAPATVITYEQNFAVPADVSMAFADSNNGGVAESSAKTYGGVGSFGQTFSNAKSSNSGSAKSTANTGYGATFSSADSHGSGSATSSAQNTGAARVVYVAPIEPVPAQQQPVVIDAKSPIFYTAYVPSAPAQTVASANANVYNAGNAASSAKVQQGHLTGRTISWRFGTAYDAPAAKSTASSYGDGAAKSSTNYRPGGSSTVQSSAASNGAGSANANANVNGAQYGNVRYVANTRNAYHGSISTNAQTRGAGNAAASANNQGLNAVDSQANSYGYGSASAGARAD